MQGSQAIHGRNQSIDGINPLNELNNRQRQIHVSQTIDHGSSSLSNLKGVTPMRAEDPYNLQKVKHMATPGDKGSEMGVLRSGSLGILPGLNRPLPHGKPSMFEYGNMPGSQSNDSSLL